MLCLVSLSQTNQQFVNCATTETPLSLSLYTLTVHRVREPQDNTSCLRLVSLSRISAIASWIDSKELTVG